VAGRNPAGIDLRSRVHLHSSALPSFAGSTSSSPRSQLYRRFTQSTGGR
jgi:hypothetical protein